MESGKRRLGDHNVLVVVRPLEMEPLFRRMVGAGHRIGVLREMEPVTRPPQIPTNTKYSNAAVA